MKDELLRWRLEIMETQLESMLRTVRRILQDTSPPPTITMQETDNGTNNIPRAT